MPVILDEALEEAYYEGDTSRFNNIGRLTGYYIPFEDILEEGEDPVDVCDAASADLEFVASIIQDYYEENESMMFPASLIYIDELEINEQYRNNGFGSKVLQELPCLLNYHKGIEIDDIAYYPADFGSTTDLIITVSDYRVGPWKKDKITLLARNNPIEYLCSKCGKKAARSVCPECIYDGGFLCEDCEDSHECGTEMLLPVCNSPRCGVCGYEGSDIYGD